MQEQSIQTAIEESAGIARPEGIAEMNESYAIESTLTSPPKRQCTGLAFSCPHYERKMRPPNLTWLCKHCGLKYGA